MRDDNLSIIIFSAKYLRMVQVYQQKAIYFGQLSQKRTWLRRIEIHFTPACCLSHWILLRCGFHHAHGSLIMTQQPPGGEGYTLTSWRVKLSCMLDLIIYNLPRSKRLQALRPDFVCQSLGTAFDIFIF